MNLWPRVFLLLATTMQTDFKMIPGQTELDTIERDLRFHPTVNPRSKMLSAAQIEQFNRDGYIRGIRIFDDAEITGIRCYFDALLAKVLAAGGDS